MGSGGGLLPLSGLAFGAAPQPIATRQATAGKVGGFGASAARRQPLKPAVAAFQVDSDDDE